MITIDFSKRGTTGLCEYLYSSIKSQILDGTLAANARLPSRRSLASHLGISVITVQNAYFQLISEGYIYSVEKKGFFVTNISIDSFGQKKTSESAKSSTSQISFQKTTKGSSSSPLYLTDFTSNSISTQKFPFTLWAHTMRQVLNTSDEKLLQRSSVKGILELRTAIANYLKAFRNMNVNAEQIIIGAGTETLYSMLVQFLGRNKIYAVENPGYTKAKDIFELNGAVCIPVNIDEQGINPEELNRTKADIIHISPNHHFPTGIVMPVRRRMELLSWVNSNPDHYILEDDYDSEFRFNGKPLPTLQSINSESRIIYMNTFTKTLSPSFRISYMVLPENLIHSFVEKMGSYSCQVSAFEQFTLARFIDEGYFETHINRMKNYYRNLRNELINEIQKSAMMPFCEIKEEESGLHFLLTVKSRDSETALRQKLQKKGINITLLSNYFYKSGSPLPQTHTFVINYSGIKKENIPETIKLMEEILIHS